MRDKHQNIEEPCEKKFSRTVLKTSGTGDSLAEFNRSAHDVQKRIFAALNSQGKGINKTILEMDIEKCFDRIDHEFMLSRVELPLSAIKGLKLAIKAGVRGNSPARKWEPHRGVSSHLS
jgi:RNA-directed DNA polymerase